MESRKALYLLVGFITLVTVLSVSLPSAFANMAAFKAVQEKDKKQNTTSQQKEDVLDPSLDSEKVDAILARMDDEQVRRLLIQELSNNKTDVEDSEIDDLGLLAGGIHEFQDHIAKIRERIELLKSGAQYEAREIDILIEKSLQQGEKSSIKDVSWKVLLLLGISFVLDFIVKRYFKSISNRIVQSPPQAAVAKAGRLSIIAVLDIVSIVLFTLFAILILFLIFDKDPMLRLVAMTYLAAILIVKACMVVARFLLSPSLANLRFIPLTDTDAKFLHAWTFSIFSVASFGWLTCGMFRVLQINATQHLLMVATIGLVITIMLIVMTLQKKATVAAALANDTSGSRLSEKIVTQLSGIWHHLAIGYLLIFWIIWATSLLLIGPKAVLPALGALFGIPAYFLIDWILKRILDAAFQVIDKPETPAPLSEKERPEQEIEAEDEKIQSAKEINEDEPHSLHISRFQHVIRVSLRLLVIALFFLWLMGLWGIDVYVGKAFIRASFTVLLTLLMGYVVWELTRSAIERKLQEEMPDEDEDMDEGGSGGSRKGTLLVLLRKFILTVLFILVGLTIMSSVGIDIGPLIAGAGIIGLAIGFGAQTLVKDIISGVFFLIDDAFRVGDYIETGSLKGTVDHISIRSLRLRHHRGMVITIPFSDIKQVTNYTRDYIIMKLEYRVKYDSDVDKIRKIVKKINKEIQKDEEMGPFLLDKVKSAGVKALDDSAMIMRIKFKCVPGEQFVIRREVFKRLREKFEENGVEFAHRNVTVYLPEEQKQQNGQGTPEEKETLKQKAGAAAIAAVQQQEAEAAKTKNP